jgi:protein CpxP
MGALGPMMLGRLGLSSTQRGDVAKVLESHRDEQQAIGQRSRDAHEALDAAIAADTFDEGLVRTRAAELAIVEADAAVARARIYGEILKILTPEQRSQLKQLQTDRQTRRAEMEKNRQERRQQRRR